MFLRHMSEAEALRLLHDVVDVHHLERKLKQNFSGEKVLEEVCWVRFVCGVGVHLWLNKMNKHSPLLHLCQLVGCAWSRIGTSQTKRFTLMRA